MGTGTVAVNPMTGAAAARELLTRFAAELWQVDASILTVRDGTITDETTKDAVSCADLAKSRASSCLVGVCLATDSEYR